MNTKYANQVSNETLTQDKLIRVVAYCRISTDEQEKNWFWLDAQKRMVKDYINKNKAEKWWIFNENTDLYVDSWFSGSLESRPAFDRLKDNVMKWLIGHIVVTDFDRPFRDVMFFLAFIDLLKKHKTTLESILQMWMNVFTHEWRLQLTFMQGFSEYERRKISMRTMTWKMEKCRQGFVINSNTKYWFDIERSWENWRNKTIVVNKDEAKVIKEIFNKFYYEGKTQCEIARDLTLKKIPTRSDTDSKSKAKSRNWYWVWTQEKISDLLRREEYIWVSYYWKTKTEYWVTTLLPKEDWIPVNCPSIIEKDLFYNVQKMLEAKVNPTRKKNTNIYILSWHLKCPYCNYSYQWYKSWKWNYYYRCKWWKSMNLNIENPCRNKQISWVLIEKFIWNIIKEIIWNPSRFSKNFERMVQEKSNIKKYENEIAGNIESMEKKKRELTSYIMMRANSQSIETWELYDNLINRHESEIKDLVNKNYELNQIIKSELTNSDMSEILMKLSKTFSKNILSIESSKRDKEALLKMIINKISLSTDIMDVYLNFSSWNIINIWEWKLNPQYEDDESETGNTNDNWKHLIKLTFKRELINSYEYDKKKSVFEHLVR